MKIGLVGYQRCGKSTLFEWLTGVRPDPALAHTLQSAMAPVPDARMEPLCGVYHPKKVTYASLELVDTPGLARSHEGNAARLAQIREADCLVLVVPAFDRPDPSKDLTTFQEDLLLADLQIVTGRIERLQESVRKPRPNRDQELAELAALEPLVAVLESGRPLTSIELSEEQQRATRSFRLFTEKPRLLVVNVADDEERPERFVELLAGHGPAFAAPLGLELELARMSDADRAEMLRELGLAGSRKDELLRALLDASQHFLYFTAGEKEVRSWLLRRGGTALEAAANVHSDLARGFIRAETVAAADLIRLGSEREVKAQHLLRQEPKDYVVQDGDVLHIRFSV
jgi:ribosome-binding ATPase YchF (GTP1/OBG family)